MPFFQLKSRLSSFLTYIAICPTHYSCLAHFQGQGIRMQMSQTWFSILRSLLISFLKTSQDDCIECCKSQNQTHCIFLEAFKWSLVSTWHQTLYLNNVTSVTALNLILNDRLRGTCAIFEPLFAQLRKSIIQWCLKPIIHRKCSLYRKGFNLFVLSLS